jgi:hypothetical protein
MIKEQVAGLPTAEVCREHGMSEPKGLKGGCARRCRWIAPTHLTKQDKDSRLNRRDGGSRVTRLIGFIPKTQLRFTLPGLNDTF